MRATRPCLAVVAVLLELAFLADADGAGTGARASDVAASTSARIPQPSLDNLANLTRRRLAPEGQRVDLLVPTFTHPTHVTNPLFPISDLRSAVLVGRFEGKPWRAETTLLPETRIVDWDGKKIETLQSQFVAYLSGRIYEVAVDLYAQADDGSVWYFGEDAFSYDRGHVSGVNETWHAGVDGPATMIMPGQPRVGDVYRPENIPGLIFEQVTVKEVGQVREGPVGPVAGVMVGQELHMEGDVEDKTFAPGYGELRSGLGDDYEANALAIPADALPEPSPAELAQLLSGALRAFEAARSQDWQAAAAGIDGLRIAYAAHQRHGPAKRLDAQMTDALDALGRAVQAQDSRGAPLAALDVARGAADLTLRYRPPAEIDLLRLDLWARELTADAGDADAGGGDADAVAGDVATMGWLRDRVALAGADAQHADDQLRYLVAAAEAKDLWHAAVGAERLRTSLAGLAPK